MNPYFKKSRQRGIPITLARKGMGFFQGECMKSWLRESPLGRPFYFQQMVGIPNN
jgi:hypothetical protein